LALELWQVASRVFLGRSPDSRPVRAYWLCSKAERSGRCPAVFQGPGKPASPRRRLGPRLCRQPFPQHFEILLHPGDHGFAIAVVVFMMLRYGAGESCGLEPFEKRFLHHPIAQWNPTLPPAVACPLPEEILHEDRGEVALHET